MRKYQNDGRLLLIFCNIQCQSIIVVLENMLTAVVGYASVESEDMASPTFLIILLEVETGSNRSNCCIGI